MNSENNRNDIIKTSYREHSDKEKLKAAYALNMCTISVSQIVDYNDSYILEQEYDAILNNLNLKEIPKDEALLRILTELLNTITYFRIQEIKKQQIEKKYNQRIKNAIWSAVPSLSVIVSGNPIAIALSIATQVGTGYMNYRKEKNNAKNDKEDSEIELEITAIEQFNALRRELFTTAWRLADEYDFEDEWRITEKQIKQYNKILTDPDELRKYARLESIADKFVAYPPFWYFYGHTANYISEMAKNHILEKNRDDNQDYYKESAIIKRYRCLAKKHFERFYELSENSILREDQLTASFALEYLDILIEDRDVDPKSGKGLEKANDLVLLAEKMAPNSFDVIQLCVIAYLRIGNTDEAARLLKVLVNEGYNLTANAKLLSRIYVSRYIFGNNEESINAMAEYQLLEKTAESVYLFPMPEQKMLNTGREDRELQERYIEEQKMLLQKDYRFVINEYIKKCIIAYNKLWPVPYTAHNVNDDYFDYSIDSGKDRKSDVEKALNGVNKEEYIAELRDSSFRTHFLDLLNHTLCSLDELSVFRNCKEKDDLIQIIRKKIVLSKNILKLSQEKLERGKFTYKDFELMEEAVSFRTFTEQFFDELKLAITRQLDDVEEVAEELGETPMRFMESAELDLTDFCNRHSLPDPEETRKIHSGVLDLPEYNYYFDYSIIGDDIEKEVDRKARREKMLMLVKEVAPSLIIGNRSEAVVLLPETIEFDCYFNNVKLNGAGLKAEVLAVIDDRTKRDYDFLLTYKGFVIVKKNEIQKERPYRLIDYIKLGKGDELNIGSWPERYSNNNVDIIKLYELIQKLSEIIEAV